MIPWGAQDYGPVHWGPNQPAYRAGVLCGNLTSSLILIRNLVFVYMSRRAGPLNWTTVEIWVGGMIIFPYEQSIRAAETKTSILLMRCLSRQWDTYPISVSVSRLEFLHVNTR